MSSVVRQLLQRKAHEQALEKKRRRGELDSFDEITERPQLPTMFRQAVGARFYAESGVIGVKTLEQYYGKHRAYRDIHQMFMLCVYHELVVKTAAKAKDQTAKDFYQKQDDDLLLAAREIFARHTYQNYVVAFRQTGHILGEWGAGAEKEWREYEPAEAKIADAEPLPVASVKGAK